jgi:hypothetical protein
LKREIQKLVVDMFPRDSEGVTLAEAADTPSMRRPAWVMDELYHSLKLSWDKEDASKGLKYAINYVRRERLRQQRVAYNNTVEASEERAELMSQVNVWTEGPYGRAWAANMRDRPRPQQLLAVSKPTTGATQVYDRFAFFSRVKYYINIIHILITLPISLNQIVCPMQNDS